jgi:hypothetical protein
MPITVKIDGIGGRFGKDQQGRPFFESSKSGPIQSRNAFSQYVASKGVINPVTVDRAQKYDKLYDEIMGLISKLNATFGEDFLKDKKVVCEMLYLPMAEKEGNRYRFINLAYDIPKGINLVVVPLHVIRSSNGKISSNSKIIVDKLCNLKRIDDVLFLNNRAKIPRSIDVTVALQDMDLNDIRAKLASRDKSDKEHVSQALLQAKNKIAEILINSSDISGKDILGTEFEGIILHTKSGPIKITSPAMKAAMQQKQQSATSSGPKSGKIALITAGSFVGHKGHQQLVNSVLQKAAELGADPYVYITSTVGPDDPIEPRVKLKTWQTLYPQHKNIFQLVRPDGSIGKKIEKELITSSNPPPYDHIVMMVGNDRSEGFQGLMNHLARRLKNPKYPGFDHVKFNVIGTPRDQESGGTGITFTDLRNHLKDQNLTPEDKLDKWVNAFDLSKLGQKYIEKLMKLTNKGMNMNKQKLKEFVTNVKNAIPNATPAQRRKLIRLMEEAKKDLDISPSVIDRRTDSGTFSKDIDPEYRMTMDFAKQHYPMAKTEEEAFAKFVTRSLKHSKEDSEEVKIRMEEIIARLDKVEALVKKMNVRKSDVAESTDYTEEK